MNAAGYLTPAPESPPEPVEAVETHPPINGFDIAHYRPPYPRSVTGTAPPTPNTPNTPSASSLHSSGYFRPTPDPDSDAEDGPAHDYPPCTAAEVIAALVEEDMERLIIRRHAGAEAGGGVFGGGRSNELGIGLVARRVKDDVLPLKSTFFDWSCEYYTESQMKVRLPPPHQSSLDMFGSSLTPRPTRSRKSRTSPEASSTTSSSGGGSATSGSSSKPGRHRSASRPMSCAQRRKTSRVRPNGF
jgi:hypothetical protein